MAYNFKIKHDVEIPEVVRARGGGVGLGLPFDDMKVGKGTGTKATSIFVGRDFWKDRMDDAAIDRKGGDGKNSGPTEIRNRIKNSFTAWRAKDKKREKYEVVVQESFDKDGKYEGSNVWISAAGAAKAA